jgi:hypothetical protein
MMVDELRKAEKERRKCALQIPTIMKGLETLNEITVMKASTMRSATIHRLPLQGEGTDGVIEVVNRGFSSNF